MFFFDPRAFLKKYYLLSYEKLYAFDVGFVEGINGFFKWNTI